MSGESVGPVEIGAHAGDAAQTALFGGSHAFAEEVAIVEESAVAMERDRRGVEGEDAGDADEDDLRLSGVPVVGPLFDVHDGGVVLGHVALAHAPDALLPGQRAGIKGGQARGERDEVRGQRGRLGGCACGEGIERAEACRKGQRSGACLEEGAAIEHEGIRS